MNMQPQKGEKTKMNMQPQKSKKNKNEYATPEK